MATSDQPVRHHHVPVFYLRKWANPAGRIVVTRKTDAGLHRSEARPESVGFEKNLWAFEAQPSGDRQAVEREVFAKIDAAAAPVLRKLTETRDQPTDEEAATWVQFLQSLHIRVPANVWRVRNEAPTALAALLAQPDEDFDRLKGHHPAAHPAEFLQMEAPHVLADAGARLLPLLVGNEQARGALLGMRWMWRRLGPGAPTLLTADVPLILVNGLYDPDCLIALPLSPRHVFFATRQERVLRRIAKESDAAVVRKTNESVAVRSARFVVGECEERFLAVRWGFAARR